MDAESVFINLIIETRRNGSQAAGRPPRREAPESRAADSIRSVLGQVLYEQRRIRGFTQEALALMASVSPKFYGEIERGIRQPTITTLCKLACALEVRPSLLIERMEQALR